MTEAISPSSGYDLSMCTLLEKEDIFVVCDTDYRHMFKGEKIISLNKNLAEGDELVSELKRQVQEEKVLAFLLIRKWFLAPKDKELQLKTLILKLGFFNERLKASSQQTWG